MCYGAIRSEPPWKYGSRVGVWRILETCRRAGVPASWWACARALERNPRVARALVAAGHEICGHGYGWEEFHGATRDEERDNIRRTVESLVRTTGERPLGWFTRYACSPDTRELLAEEGGFLYDSLGLNPRMMSIGLHCRIAGTPARSRAFVEFLEYARRFPGVWFARRVDIARWWLEHQPPALRSSP